LISKLLTYDPEHRPSAEEILKHPWIVEKSTQAVDSNVAMGALSNLKSFRADQKLKQATFAFIASQLLTKSEKEDLAKIFKAIDKNGDGKLSKEEILDGYDKFFGTAMNKDDVEKMFDAVDIDKSGFIDYSEFVVAAMNEKTLLTNEKLQTAFNMFDKVRILIKLSELIGRQWVHIQG
jgi:calcium-dependent protein kinase